VTIYGLFDIGVEAAKSGGGATVREISGGSFGSRLGFRGVEDLGGGLSAVFRLENGFAGDSGVLAQGGLIFGREASVGLSKQGFGTVTLGRIPTPVSLAQANVDAFFWMGGGGLISITRSGTSTLQLIPQVVSARVDNALNYASPKWGGFEIRALVSAGERSTALGQAEGFSARYADGAWDLLAAYGRQNGGPNGGRIKSVVAGGSYDFKWAKFYLGYTDEDNACSTCTGSLAGAQGVPRSRFRLANAGVRVPFGAATAIAQVGKVGDRSRYTVNPGDRDATWLAVGGEYALSKRTAFYGSIATISNQNGSRYALGSGGVQQPAGFVGPGDPRSKSIVIGLRHVF
jgi:predicted porin